MGTLDKLIRKILDNQKISYKDAERVLFYMGFKLKVTGSHHVFRKVGSKYNISLKKRPQLFPYQVKMLRCILTSHGYKDE